MEIRRADANLLNRSLTFRSGRPFFSPSNPKMNRLPACTYLKVCTYLIIDLDPQASAAHWADRREAALPTVLAAPASRLRPELDRALAAGVDLLYLDTAPHSDSAALKVARAADLVLIPCRTAILDLEAITDTVQFLATTGTPALVVLNAVSPHGHDADLLFQARGLTTRDE